MFDLGLAGLPDVADLGAADDAVVSAAVVEFLRIENAAAARRLASVAEFADRELVYEDDPRVLWVCDFWDWVAAEVAARQHITHRAAGTQMRLGLALRHRLPKVAAVFAEGRLTQKLVATIAWRTHLVEDPVALDAIDTDLAAAADRFGVLSAAKTEQAIDAAVIAHDPMALRRARTAVRSRDVSFGDDEDEAGTCALWGRLTATDAALLKECLQGMAEGVCPQDPRTMGQRRADALGTLAAGARVLACLCEQASCPATGPDPRAAAVVIHVLADLNATTAERDEYLHGEYRRGPEPRAAAPAEPAEKPPTAPVEPPADPRPAQCRPTQPPIPELEAEPGTADAEPVKPVPAQAPAPGHAVIPGGAVIPPWLLAELIATGARLRPLALPGDEPEPRHRPSAVLDRFVRMRDMTCRYAGCDQPAVACDLDHVRPWPAGVTHPSNLSPKCRRHHLLKTFWQGFSDRQDPDGTVAFTTPTGYQATTVAGSRLLFPHWNITTADLGPPPPMATPATPGRTLKMPLRKQSRAKTEEQRRKAERKLNEIELHDNSPPF